MTKIQRKTIARHIVAALADQFDRFGFGECDGLLTEEDENQIIDEIALIVMRLSKEHGVMGTTREVVETVIGIKIERK